jgi:hypothetical protein
MLTLPSIDDCPLEGDRIAGIHLSSVYLPLATPISDAKVLTGGRNR